jgi:ABC-type sugar transport system substrate-binding protein
VKSKEVIIISSTTKGINVDNEIKDIIKNAVRFFEGQEYIGHPTTLDEAIEIVQSIVEDALAELQS